MENSNGTKTKVNTGTWNYYYNITEVAYSSTNSRYQYYIDAWYTATSTYYWNLSDNTLASYYGTKAYTNGWYYTDSISISTNKGAFLSDGADRSYTLTLEYSTYPSLTYKGIALSAKVLLDDATKTVTEYTGTYDTITITHNKTNSAAKALVPNKMNAPSSISAIVKP